MLVGKQLLCCLLLPLLQRGHGDAEYWDLEDEEPPEVLGGPARCQDTYQDWISLYCWAPFHAALMATPEGSHCCWDQISRWVSISPGGAKCTLGSAPLRWTCPRPGRPASRRLSAAPTASSPAAPSCWLSCFPVPGPALSSTPSSCRSTPSTSPTARRPGPPGWAGCPPGWPWLWPWGSAALCPSQPPLRLAEPEKGLKSQRAAAQPLPAPVPARGWKHPPSLPALGTNEWDEEAPATRPEAPAAPTKNRTRGAPTLRPPECQGLMASRCSRSPVKGPAVPRSGGSHGMRRVGQLCQDFCWGTRSPARSSFRSREGPSELRFIALGFTLCGSRGRAVKGEALGSHSALGQR
ncbi:receptor activity-modifying protein 2 isoform X2 [Grus americana]|uniref:receptor activity-modifying protein 2 isoform X2 n=1 Tax=Grus americana TaxID=9117 RepID=UPI002407E9C8|nr:receptor activity-modifying protein 2 isoform X2 [Grus americana]